MPSYSLPEDVNDEAAIISFAKETVARNRGNRWSIERGWYHNLLYYLGKQWVVYDESIRAFRPKALKPWVPKPVTNMFASTLDTIISTVGKVDPQVDFRPASQQEEDIATAQVSGRILDIVKEEIDFQRIRYELVPWVVLTGNAFLYQQYSKSKEYGVVTIPNFDCLVCGKMSPPQEITDAGNVCPKCGVNSLKQSASGTELPKGKLVCEVVSPFEIFLDNESQRIKNSIYVIRVRSFDIEYLKQLYPDYSDKIQTEGPQHVAVKYLENLAYMSATSTFGYFGSGSGVGENRGTLTEVFIRRTDSLPEGLYAAIVNGELVVEKGELKYHNSEGNPVIPITHFKYKHVPGRVWGKTPADDLIPKQRQRNELESFIQLIVHRMSAPGILLPENSGISNLSGEPGWIQKWNPAGTGGVAPQFVPGIPVNASLFRWLDKIDAEFSELAKVFDVMKGNAPAGVEAYAALQLLDERGQSGFADIFLNAQLGYQEWAEYALDIFREYASDDRYTALKDEMGKWSLQKFSSADLTGRVNIVAETGMMLPRSGVSRRAIVEQEMKMGLLNVQDPQIAYSILRMFGTPELIPGDLDLDYQAAARENDDILTGQPIEPPQVYENHLVHLSTHRKFLVSEKFRDLRKAAIAGDANALQMVQMALAHYQATLTFVQMSQMPPPGSQPGNVGKANPDTGANLPGRSSRSRSNPRQLPTEGEVNQRDSQGASSDVGQEGRHPGSRRSLQRETGGQSPQTQTGG